MGEEASVYMWEWWWGRRLVCTYVGVVVGEEASVYIVHMWEWWWGRRLVCTYVGVVVGEEASS